MDKLFLAFECHFFNDLFLFLLGKYTIYVWGSY